MQIPLFGDIKIPSIGFKTWRLPSDQAPTIVSMAIDIGYTHFDFAHIYNNEPAIGSVFKSVPNREKFFLTSKLWSDSHSSEKVRSACEKSIEDLQCKYLDMYLIHNPARIDSNNIPIWYKKEWIFETWAEMLKLKDLGLCKSVGVSNFTTKKLDWVIEEYEKPSNNQVELHPYLPQHKLLKFCQDNGIVATAYSPLAPHSAPSNSSQIENDNLPFLLNDPILNEIASKHKTTVANIALSWGIHRNTPVLVKSSSKERMIENLNSYKIELSKEDMDKIQSICTKNRFRMMKYFCNNGHTLEEYWDGEYYN